jgi:hypothetical protein
MNPPGLCYQKPPQTPSHLTIRNCGIYISIPTKKGSPATMSLFQMPQDPSESKSYLPGRIGAGTTGEGPQTSVVTFKARVRSSVSVFCVFSWASHAAQVAISANS